MKFFLLLSMLFSSILTATIELNMALILDDLETPHSCILDSNNSFMFCTNEITAKGSIKQINDGSYILSAQIYKNDTLLVSQSLAGEWNKECYIKLGEKQGNTSITRIGFSCIAKQTNINNKS